MTLSIIAAAVVVVAANGCGYSEPEMQAQRDQIAGCRSVLTEVSINAANNEAAVAALQAENDRLKTQLSTCSENNQR